MSNKTEFVDKEEVVIYHNVNLQAKRESPQLVRSCYINIRRKRHLLGILSSTPIAEYKLEVTCTPDSRLIVSNNNHLIYLQYGEQQASAVTISDKDNQIDFQIYFDPDQVLDCTDVETDGKDQYDINYNVTLTTDNGEVVSSLSGQIQISLSGIVTESPIFTFSPNDTGKSLTYSLGNAEPMHIGHIKIRNAGNLLRAPFCNITFKIIGRPDEQDVNADIPGLITLGTEYEEGHPRVILTSEGTGVKPIGTSGSDLSCRLTLTSGTITGLAVNITETGPFRRNDNIISIPVFWDMTKVQNPTEGICRYILFVSAQYTFNNKACQKSQYDDMVIELHRNTRIMDLNVRLTDGNSSECLKSGIEPTTKIPMMVSGMTTGYRFELVNTAQAIDPGKTGAGIYVRDFFVDLPVCGTSYHEKSGHVQTRLFEPDNTSTLQGNGDSFFIPVNRNRSLGFTYDHTCIDRILDDTGNEIFEKIVKIPVHFSYFVDKNAEYTQAKVIPAERFESFSTSVPIQIRKEPTPEWLCIDFGTSAVVASYGCSFFDDHGARVDCILPLKEQKKAQFKRLYRGENEALRMALADDSEEDGRLINSTAVVNPSKTSLSQGDIDYSIRNITDYRHSHVMFSPSNKVIDIYSRMLPSLKILMGNQSLPEQLLPTNVEGGAGIDAVSVTKLFELIYRQFFALFLPDKALTTNKVILTVPNTYAPRHVKILRELASQLLPNLRQDYTRFLSESDAVAFYYLAKRREFMEKTMRERKGYKFSDEFDSNILVYDMGAGTLDLTYITKKKEGGKWHIHVKGKMGVSKAGNYLDYILAEIIVGLLADRIESENTITELRNLVSLDGNATLTTRTEAGKLKAYVRNSLKPNLNHDESEKLPQLKLLNTQMPMNEITIGDVTGNDKYKTFLQEVADEVFFNFKSLFDSGDEKVQPKLVIFSGRTTCLTTLRKAVEHGLREQGLIQDDCTFLDLSKGVYCNGINPSEDYTDTGSLKTSVVEGALAFCSIFSSGNGNHVLHSRNVYAQYGVIFKTGAQWDWHPLIDTHTRHVACDDSSINQDGFTIYQYDSSQHDASERQIEQIGTMEASHNRNSEDFSIISAAYVIQSYSPHTKRDWEEGNRDYISVIGYVNLENFNETAEYRLTIDQDNQITFHIGAGRQTFLPHDEYTSQSFKNSMWPIVR